MKRITLPMAHIERIGKIPKLIYISHMTHYFYEAIPVQEERHLMSEGAFLFNNGFNMIPSILNPHMGRVCGIFFSRFKNDIK